MDWHEHAISLMSMHTDRYMYTPTQMHYQFLNFSTYLEKSEGALKSLQVQNSD